MSQRKHVVETCKKVFASQDIDLIKRLKAELVTADRFSIKEFQSFRIRPIALDCLDNQRLFWVAQAIDKAIPGEYELVSMFNDEINVPNANKETSDVALHFHNATQLAPEQWSAVASVSQIAKLLQSQEVSLCNSDKLDPKTSDLMYTLVPNSNRANQIAELISSDRFKYNTIRLNVMKTPDSKSPYIIDESLIIPEGQAIIIPDGYTRAAACEIAYFNHPELASMFNERFFNIIVTYLNTRDVRMLIAQEWQGEEVNKVMREGMEHGAAHTIINMIVSGGKVGANCSRNLSTPAVESAVIKSLERYMYTSRLKTEWQITSAANWLAKYYSFVSEKSPEAFQRADSWTWYAITCYASMIRGEKNWEELTELGVPLIGLSNLPVSEDTEDTEIEILKRCKGACCTSVEQSKQRKVR